MIAKFFIFRPIFAWVISLIIMISGVVSLYTLPIEQYPDIVPPQININASYSGADAKTVENSVTQIIEQQLTGLDGMLYFSSSSSSAGSSKIKITFTQEVDADIAQVQVQNKVNQILSRLPEDVQRQGVRVFKSQSDFLMLASVYDSNKLADKTDISDFLVSNLQDSISRIEGVGDVQVFGGQYAMRIWLDPYKLEIYNLIPRDIENAINAQNSQASAGRLGAMPTLDNQQLSVTVTARSMFQSVLEFENIVLKSNLDGSSVKIKDIARVEIGAQNYSNVTALNGYPASGISIQLASGANAVATSNRVKKFLKESENILPAGYKIAYPRDTTHFIQASINEVVKTLIEAIILVILVMFLFLKNIRATLIPAIAVPVVLLGTFAVLNIFGYTINTLTMFALVLAIGLLVDDAIVVVENVERNMKELKLSAKEATIISMNEVTGALLGITTVLSVVFLPMAFFSGSTGIIYRQFSITIISSMILSVIVALTLTPALCATILKPHKENNINEQKSRGFIFWFDTKFENFSQKYSFWVEKLLFAPKKWMLFYLVIIATSSYIFIKLPTSFLPKEDQGSLMVQYTLPVGAVASRTVDVANIVRDYFMNEESEALNTIFTISGFSSRSSGQNVGTAYVSLKNWDLRDKNNHVDKISQRATKAFNDPNSSYFIRDARVFTINPSVIQGLGSSDGFEFQLLGSSNLTREELKNAKDKIIEEANKNLKINSIRADGTEESPQLKISYDTNKALALGLNLKDIDTTLSAAWGGTYVNDYIDKTRVKRVYIQGDAPFRSSPEDLYKWKVRNNSGSMTPFSEFSSFSWVYAPEELTRFNGFMSYEIQGSAAIGISSGVAMSEMDKIANSSNSGVMYAYSGASYQEKLASNQTLILYSISLLVVFLCLAALYESWSVPFSVLLVVPLGVFGAVFTIYFRDLSNDVYFQVALLAVMGLASKNAILIVEFINSAYKDGMDLTQAAIKGAKLRLRPIIMTSLAFIAGIIPLAISSGAGANSRIAIGTAILGGTLSATILAIFFVPLFFIVIKKIFSKKVKMFRKSLSLAFFSLFFSSCVSMAPNLEINSDDTISKSFKNYQIANSNSNISLNNFLIDENLKLIVNIALENNKDLNIALLRVEESKSLYRIEGSNLYPKIDANGSFAREKKDNSIKNSYKASIGTVFELDLFGKNQSLNDAAKNSFFATQYALDSTKLTLVSQTINSYLSLASNLENLALQKEINFNLASVYELTKKKFQAGVISKEDVLSSNAMLKESENQIITYENLVQIDINSLELLLGVIIPQNLIPNSLKKDDSYLALLKSGIDSNILLNRPDIKELEYKLRAKNANIGAARAAFFPSISLTASTGFASPNLSSLFSSSSNIWQLSPSINIPIFSAGENSAKLNLSKTQKEIALNEYQKGIQTAFKEVNDALMVRKNIFTKLQNQKELTQSVLEAYDISLNSYKIGYGSYLNMLIAQKAYINSQKTLIKTYLEELENRVEIFKTLGGKIDE